MKQLTKGWACAKEIWDRQFECDNKRNYETMHPSDTGTRFDRVLSQDRVCITKKVATKMSTTIKVGTYVRNESSDTYLHGKSTR